MYLCVVGTHEYQWALHPFAHLYRKHWTDEPVTWYGDRVDGLLPDNVTFKRVPAFRRNFGHLWSVFGIGEVE